VRPILTLRTDLSAPDGRLRYARELAEAVSVWSGTWFLRTLAHLFVLLSSIGLPRGSCVPCLFARSPWPDFLAVDLHPRSPVEVYSQQWTDDTRARYDTFAYGQSLLAAASDVGYLFLPCWREISCPVMSCRSWMSLLTRYGALPRSAIVWMDSRYGPASFSSDLCDVLSFPWQIFVDASSPGFCGYTSELMRAALYVNQHHRYWKFLSDCFLCRDDYQKKSVLVAAVSPPSHHHLPAVPGEHADLTHTLSEALSWRALTDISSSGCGSLLHARPS
jgi:hypothetical protein